MSATMIDRTGTRDGLLRFAMRADAAITGLAGLAGIPLAGWLSATSGTTKAFEYGMSNDVVGRMIGPATRCGKNETNVANSSRFFVGLMSFR